MSYARFSEGDLYMYQGGDSMICMECRLRPEDNQGWRGDWVGDKGATFYQDALAHAMEHKAAGHVVPARTVERLQADIARQQKGLEG